ncbi:hypothetical protein [Parasedimentitalea maritima]|nr:hypothetical protein [Zongyanglinia marina]
MPGDLAQTSLVLAAAQRRPVLVIAADPLMGGWLVAPDHMRRERLTGT